MVHLKIVLLVAVCVKDCLLTFHLVLAIKQIILSLLILSFLGTMPFQSVYAIGPLSFSRLLLFSYMDVCICLNHKNM